ncbi:MAG: hypothetical protein HFE78_02035 [Clostridiales bacterium]|nr:hypothetical protein [Clostridiales bacterium]
MKKITSVLLAIGMLCGIFMMLPAGAAEIGSFTDLDENAWYYPGIAYAVENGLMVGESDTMFAPDLTLTRAMFVAMLSRLSDEKPSDDVELTFTDVPENEWYYDHIRWAYENNVVSGHSDTSFAPEEPVTREQMCLIAVNFAKHMGYEFAEPTGISAFLKTTFLDDEEINTWAYDAVYACADAGIVSGTGAGAFEPQGKSTRAEAASLLRRFIRSTTTTIGEGVVNEENKTITYTCKDKFADYAVWVDTYDENDKVIKSEYSDDLAFTSVTEYTYDQDGNLASEKYEDSKKESYTITYQYDDEKALVSFTVAFTDKDGVQREAVYDKDGILTSAKETLGDTVNYTEYYADGTVKLTQVTMRDEEAGYELSFTTQFDEQAEVTQTNITIVYNGRTMEVVATAETESMKITLEDDSWYLYEQAIDAEEISYTDSQGTTKTLTAEEAYQEIMEKMGLGDELPELPPVDFAA